MYLSSYLDFTEKIDRPNMFLMIATELAIFTQAIRIMSTRDPVFTGGKIISAENPSSNHPIQPLEVMLKVGQVINLTILGLLAIIIPTYEGTSVMTFFYFAMFVLVHILGTMQGSRTFKYQTWADIRSSPDALIYIMGLLFSVGYLGSWIASSVL